MKIIKLLSIYIMSFFYIYIGVKHFLDLEYFMNIMPKYIPYHKTMIYISGILEILLGTIIIIPKWRSLASYGLILLLLAVFPANIYLYTSKEAQEILEISKQDALIRMPFQVLLIIIAYWHSLKNSSKNFSYICLFLFLVIIIYFAIII
tara:strand:+ start:214 stop:660 length:447 start_codon:yes stop_codon:yes gene_type:complete